MLKVLKTRHRTRRDFWKRKVLALFFCFKRLTSDPTPRSPRADTSVVSIHLTGGQMTRSVVNHDTPLGDVLFKISRARNYPHDGMRACYPNGEEIRDWGISLKRLSRGRDLQGDRCEDAASSSIIVKFFFLPIGTCRYSMFSLSFR